MDKQDRQGARTVSQLEQKYGFGKSFAEVYGIATGARKTAEEAKETAEEAKTKAENPDHKAIFNALTADGTLEGLYRKDGSLYINASYIKSGVYTGKGMTFFEPGRQEVEMCKLYALGIIPTDEEALRLFDFNGDNVIDDLDVQIAVSAATGESPLKGVWSGAVNTEVTMTIDVHSPEKFVSVSGRNMWGRIMDFSIGSKTAIFEDNGSGNFYRMEGGTKEWLNPPIGGFPADGKSDGSAYRTIERSSGSPIYKRVNYDLQSGLFGVEEYCYADSEFPSEWIWYPLRPKDAVIQRGTDGIWTYEKWHSGKLECWGMAQHTAASSDFVSFQTDYPVPFIATPVVTVSAGANGGWVKDRYPYLNTVSTTGVAITYRNATSNAITSDLHIHAIGRWK